MSIVYYILTVTVGGKSEIVRTDPFMAEKKWIPTQGWRCALALIALNVAISFVLQLAFLTTGNVERWVNQHLPLIQDIVDVFRDVSWLFIAFASSKSGSMADFVARIGLARWPDIWGWVGGCVGIAIAWMDHYWIAKGVARSDQTTREIFSAGGGPLACFILVAILFAPVFEEIALRGLIYKAFRSSYGWMVSTVLVLIITSYFHWVQIASSPYSATCLLLLFVLLCVLRERTSSLWNCILCHAAYNMAGTLVFPISCGAMLLLLPFIIRQQIMKGSVLEK